VGAVTGAIFLFAFSTAVALAGLFCRVCVAIFSADDGDEGGDGILVNKCPIPDLISFKIDIKYSPLSYFCIRHRCCGYFFSIVRVSCVSSLVH
jgi:hypothetical protein